MSKTPPLRIYEEIMLLGLRNDKGTPHTSFLEYVLGGAILAELLLEGRILVDDDKKKFIGVKSTETLSDELLDEALEKITSSKRRGSMQTWVTRLAGLPSIQERVARQLVAKNILRVEESKILFLFTRKIFPEFNPVPEQKLLKQIGDAIFSDATKVDVHTTVLISLARSADLLAANFGKKETKARKERIDQIVKGEFAGRVTQEVIQACQTAVMVAAIMPAIIATTVIN